jgi:hypothetical protein
VDDWELFGFAMLCLMAVFAAIAVMVLVVCLVELLRWLCAWLRSGRWRRDLWTC